MVLVDRRSDRSRVQGIARNLSAKEGGLVILGVRCWVVVERGCFYVWGIASVKFKYVWL